MWHKLPPRLGIHAKVHRLKKHWREHAAGSTGKPQSLGIRATRHPCRQLLLLEAIFLGEAICLHMDHLSQTEGQLLRWLWPRNPHTGHNLYNPLTSTGTLNLKLQIRNILAQHCWVEALCFWLAWKSNNWPLANAMQLETTYLKFQNSRGFVVLLANSRGFVVCAPAQKNRIYKRL